MRKFLQYSLFFVFPLLAIPIINFYADPAHVYSYEQYERHLVYILQKSPYVTNIDGNHNERFFKKLLIDNVNDSINSLIVGSSRIMTITDSVLNDSLILNLGVSGATYEDIAALIFYFLEQQKKVNTILIGIDPQHFNANIGDTRWKTLQNEYHKYANTVLDENRTFSFVDVEKVANLYSITYFKQAFQMKKSSDVPLPSHVFTNKEATYGRDGAFSYGENMRNLSMIEVEKLAKENIYHQWENFTQISLEEVERWGNLITYLQLQNIEVCFVEMPYHPYVYERFTNESQYEMMKEAMSVIDSISKKYCVPIIGSFNPADYKLNSADFYDGMHLRYDGVCRVIHDHIK